MKKDAKAKGKSMKQMNSVPSALTKHKNETGKNSRTVREKCVTDGSSSSTPSSMYDFMAESPQLHSSKSIDVCAPTISKTAIDINARRISKRVHTRCTSKDIGAKSTNNQKINIEDKENSESKEFSQHAPSISQGVQKRCKTKDIGAKKAKQKRKLDEYKESSVTSKSSLPAHPFSKVVQKRCTTKDIDMKSTNNPKRKLVNNKESSLSSMLSRQSAITHKGAKCKSEKLNEHNNFSETPMAMDKVRNCVANEVVNESKHQEKLTTLEAVTPFNLDDISAIATFQKSYSRKRVAQMIADNSVSSKKDHYSKGLDDYFNPTFLGPQMKDLDKSDSALFVSPRQAMPRFSTRKSITPEITSSLTHKKDTKIKNKMMIKGKETSTPIEAKLKKSYTTIKEKIPKLSPVLRVDTPTSDYGSMDSFITPKVIPAEKVLKREADSPAFTLEEYAEKAELNLNKSMNKSYTKSKRKYESGTDAVTKIEKWAEKVNSELEDVENFELSVEG